MKGLEFFFPFSKLSIPFLRPSCALPAAFPAFSINIPVSNHHTTLFRDNKQNLYP